MLHREKNGKIAVKIPEVAQFLGKPGLNMWIPPIHEYFEAGSNRV